MNVGILPNRFIVCGNTGYDGDVPLMPTELASVEYLPLTDQDVCRHIERLFPDFETVLTTQRLPVPLKEVKSKQKENVSNIPKTGVRSTRIDPDKEALLRKLLNLEVNT